MKIINKHANSAYNIEEKLSVGMVLEGHEVKSLRIGKGSLKGSFIKIINDEAFVHNMHIHPYEYARLEDYEPTHPRKLLLKKKEILKLKSHDQRKGVAIIPLKIYFSGRLIKMEIGVGKGKQQFERRADIKKRDQERELRSRFKQSQLG